MMLIVVIAVLTLLIVGSFSPAPAGDVLHILAIAGALVVVVRMILSHPPQRFKSTRQFLVHQITIGIAGIAILIAITWQTINGSGKISSNALSITSWIGFVVCVAIVATILIKNRKDFRQTRRPASSKKQQHR